MSSIFEKFSLYDLFAIYVPGAGMAAILKAVANICLLYFRHCYQTVPPFLKLMVNVPDALLFSLGGYIMGVLIHEIGKYLSERLNLFEIPKLSGWIFGIDKSYRRHLPIIKKIVKTNREALFSNIRKSKKEELKKIPFERAMNHVKYSKNNRNSKSSKYHFFFGLSRGLTLDVFAAILSLICLVGFGIISVALFVGGMFIAILAFVTLYCRSYRYSLSWVKNVYLQYAYDNGFTIP